MDRDIIVDDIRCRGTAKSVTNTKFSIPTREEAIKQQNESDSNKKHKVSKELTPILSDWQAWFEIPKIGLRCITTPVYSFSDLYHKDELIGPCLILQDTSTIVVRVKGSSENGKGTLYTKVDNILNINSTSSTFLIQEVQDEKYELLFGDGIFSSSFSIDELCLCR